MGSLGQKPAPHHRAILTALQKVSAGETRQLMLLLPPGAAKSTYASRLFPAWWLSQHPQSSVIMTCHTAPLAEHFGRAVRGLIEDHPQLLGVNVRNDQRAAGRFTTEEGGEFFGIGVHGAVTGRRADLALIDDPIRSFADAESFSAREHLWDWFRSELVTRMKPEGRMVLVMTRWHTDDLAGRLIEQGGWKVLRLPALAEAGDAMGRAPGEALWPDWEDREAIEAKRAMLGERQFAALFQQAPLRAGGQVFDPRLLRVVDTVPEGTGVRAWDLAGTSDASGDPDWTVGVKLVRDASGAVFVDDVIRFRAVPGEVVERIRAAAAADGVAVTVGLPKDPGQAGKSQVMFLTQLLGGYRVESTPETGSKMVRAMPVAAQMQAGTLAMRRAGWNAVFLDELASFPECRKDDQVDALSRAFSMLLGVAAPARFARLSYSSR
jgi:predicted phage terminase large subunit-like protein